MRVPIRLLVKWVLAFPLLILASIAKADTHTCGSETQMGVQFKWCIDRPESSTSPDVLYFLHGLGGDENAWQQISAGVTAEWQRLGVNAPTVISVSFGPAWFLTDIPKNGIAPRAYFITQVMPAMEAKIGGLRGRRLLGGLSMGGFNASQLLLKNGNLFSRVALICPAISTLSPFSSDAEVNQMLEKDKEFINPAWVRQVLRWSRSMYATESIWKEHSPIDLATALLTPASPDLYVSCGDHDDFGFYDGAFRFYQVARDRGENAYWKPIPGARHCAHDEVSVADFLALGHL